ncbi:MAG TPA: hypothetical protein VIU41_14265, partial [Geobacteraceae bacterium]
MKRAQKLPIICVVVLVTILALLAPAQAQLAARGPISPDNGFPLWYDDGKGLALQQCFDETTPGSGTGPCILPTAAQPEPFYKPGTPIDTTPTTVNLVPPRTVFKNFPTENFYASAITDQTFTVGGQKAFVLMALEATFA